MGRCQPLPRAPRRRGEPGGGGGGGSAHWGPATWTHTCSSLTSCPSFCPPCSPSEVGHPGRTESGGTPLTSDSGRLRKPAPCHRGLRSAAAAAAGSGEREGGAGAAGRDAESASSATQEFLTDAELGSTGPAGGGREAASGRLAGQALDVAARESGYESGDEGGPCGEQGSGGRGEGPGSVDVMEERASNPEIGDIAS